jgi:gliding motility-associated-like protein
MKKVVFILILFSICITGVIAQNIEAPDLLNATIINQDGDVQLTWQRNDTSDARIIVSRDSLEISAFTAIDTIDDLSQTTYTDRSSHANQKPRSYKLSFDVLGSTGSESNYFNTTHAQFEYDTCGRNVEISWTRYVQSNDFKDFNDTISIQKFNIWRQSVGNQPVLIGSTEPGNLSYIDNDIESNRTYQYYVETVRKTDTSIKSHSNIISITTRLPYPPTYINTDKLRTGEEDINLLYSIAENSELSQYKLLRSTQYNGPFDTLQTFNTTENFLEYTDNEVNPNDNIHYYHVVSINQCGHLTTRSDTLNNIILEVSSEDAVNQLSWTPVLVPKQKSYEINRRTGNGAYRAIQTTRELSYFDGEPATFRGLDSSGRFCYYIKGLIQSGSNRESIILSNKKCLYVEPQIFVPNAFTPNGDGLNDEFRPLLSFLSENYHLIIFDRMGRKVFESKDPNESWRGLISGGSRAPAGTYIYYLEVKNPGHSIIKKRGQINVLYP